MNILDNIDIQTPFVSNKDFLKVFYYVIDTSNIFTYNV